MFLFTLCKIWFFHIKTMEVILLWIETIYSETNDLELQSKSINFQMMSLKMQIKAWRIFLMLDILN